MKKIHLLLLSISLIFTHAAHAGLISEVEHLQQRWAEVNYQLEGKAQLSAFEQLVEEAEMLTGIYPDSAEAWIWSGIIKSTFAGAKGGLGALSLAKASRHDLEQAMALNDEALHGSVYTSLGALYFNVPGWPIGFGDKDRAEELLQHALVLNPDGIDSNYFYGSYLLEEKRYDEARDFLLKARQAAPRPGRLLADTGRQQEISDLLSELDEN